MFEVCTRSTRRIISQARIVAAQRASPIVDTVHLALALLGDESIARLLHDEPVSGDLAALKRDLELMAPVDRHQLPGPLAFSPAFKSALERSLEEAQRQHVERVEPTHLLLALLRGEGVGQGVFEAHRVTYLVVQHAHERRPRSVPPDTGTGGPGAIPCETGELLGEGNG